MAGLKNAMAGLKNKTADLKNKMAGLKNKTRPTYYASAETAAMMALM